MKAMASDMLLADETTNVLVFFDINYETRQHHATGEAHSMWMCSPIRAKQYVGCKYDMFSFQVAGVSISFCFSILAYKSFVTVYF